MADVFEARADLNRARSQLWNLIAATPSLDWLLLTKRPQNVAGMVPWSGPWPTNVWLGTTVENQKYEELRIPHLIENQAVCRFLSCEPLLGSLDLSPWIRKKGLLHWVIAGGESGALARPMHPDWALDLRDQCAKHKIAFHFKQWGHWAPMEQGNGHVLRQLVLESKRSGLVVLGRFKKKDAGRLLEGRTWDQVPSVPAA